MINLYSHEDFSRSKQKNTHLCSALSSLPSMSKRTCSRSIRQSISDENNLLSKDITVRRCNHFDRKTSQSMFCNLE